MALGPRDIVVRFTQRGEGVPEGGKQGRVSLREGSLDRRMLLPCANPACKKGGFLLRKEIDAAVAEGEAKLEVDKDCAGYVGALRTEKGKPPERCPNEVSAEVEIAYLGKK